MTTALQIITRSLLDLNVIGEGDDPSASQAADGLTYLNDLIQSLDNEGLTIYANTNEGFALSGAASYTYGTGATWNSERPMEITSCYHQVGNTNYPVDIINDQIFYGIMDRTITGTLVEKIYINETYPNMTVYTYPLVSTGTLYFNTRKPLTELAALGTSLSLPKGYERMLRLLLSVEMMPMYQINNGMIIAMADAAKSAIKRTNKRTNYTSLGLPTYGQRSRGNIISGV